MDKVGCSFIPEWPLLNNILIVLAYLAYFIICLQAVLAGDKWQHPGTRAAPRLVPLYYGSGAVLVAYITGIHKVDSVPKKIQWPMIVFFPLTRSIKQQAIMAAAEHSVGRSFISHSRTNFHKRLLVLLHVSLSNRKAVDLYFGQPQMPLLLSLPLLSVFAWTQRAHCVSESFRASPWS